MKKIKCELCGSPDIIKEGNVFVCNSCGAKYSKEEAMNLINSEDAPIQRRTKTVRKTKTSSEVIPYNLDPTYILAQQAKDTDNAEDANKYYSLLREKYPNEWEPYFYSLYYRTLCGTRGDIPKALSNLKSCAKPVILLLSNKTGKKATDDLNELYKSIYKLGLILTNEIVNWKDSNAHDMVSIEMSYSVAIPATYGKYCNEILKNDDVSQMFYSDAIANYDNWTSEKNLGHLYAQSMALHGLDILEIESEAKKLGISTRAEQSNESKYDENRRLKYIIICGLSVGIFWAVYSAIKGASVFLIIVVFIIAFIIGGWLGARYINGD